MVNALQDIIYNSLYNAMTKTMSQSYTADEINNEISLGKSQSDIERDIKNRLIEAFASEARDYINLDTISDLTDAIDSYIKSAGITIQSIPKTLVSPAGPVEGDLIILPNEVKIS